MTINSTPRRRNRLWPWFAAGFLAVFVGMLLAVRMYRVQPAGPGIERCALWEYYADEIGRAFGPARPMGPATGGSSLGTTILQHVLLSVAGGLVLAGVGRLVRRRGREPGPAGDVGSADT